MKAIGKFSFLMVLFFLTTAPLFAEPFISTRDIHPGMIGYGKTVFHGTQISTFKVEVLGVLKKALADTDLILVRIDSPYLEKRGLGLVAGMSGSPVYFKGKLAGAIAYGWPFTHQAIAGVTPIEAMLRSDIREKTPRLALGTPRMVSLPAPLRVGNQTVDSVFTLLPGEKPAQPAHAMVLRPLGFALSASGFNTEGLRELGSLFPMMNVVPGGGKMSEPDKVPLEPGQSVGAALMQGDMNVAATGTLTYRDGTKVLAFGHPFLFLGDVDFPMVQSYVHYILPSIELPFKFTSPLKDVGHVAQDRLYGIGGILGSPAHLVPVDITVSDQERKVSRRFHVEVIQHPELTPRLAALAVGQAIPATTKLLGGATASLDYTIKFAGHPPIHKKNLVFSESNIAESSTAEVLRPIMEVAGNDFQRVQLSSVTARVTVRSGIAAATLQRVVLDKHEVKPGEKIKATVWLKPYDRETVTRSFTIPIPPDVQGNVTIGIGGGPNDDQLRKALSQPPPNPLTVNQMIEQIQDAPSYNSLIIRLQLPRTGMNLGGENFNNFPQAYIDLLKSAGANPISPHADGMEFRYATPWVVIGSDVEQVSVAGKTPTLPAEAKPEAPPSTPAPGTPSPPPGGEESSPFVTYAASPLPHPVLVTKPSEKEHASPAKAAESKTSAQAPESLEASPGGATLQTYGNLKDWQRGTLANLAVSRTGDLHLAPRIKVDTRFGENILLSQTRTSNGLYVGTANPGRVYRVAPDGKKSLFLDPHTMAVLSMASLPDGDILAGTIDGKLYWLSPQGNVKFRFRLPERYIWQILPWRHALYVATGNPDGIIYRLDEQNPGKSPPSVYVRTSQSHVMSMCATADGKFFAGTANSGLLLEVKPNGTTKTVADFDEQAILSLTADPDGNLFAGTSGKGKIFELTRDGQLRRLAELPEENVSWLAPSGDGAVLAATDIPARLYDVHSNGDVSLLWDGKPSEQFGLKGDETGKWFAVSGSNAKAFHLLSSPFSEGKFLSGVIDAGGKAIWGRLVWRGQTPAESSIEVETRTGNAPIPDSTWSRWSSPYPATGAPFQSPSSRYLQFRIRLSSANRKVEPSIQALSYFWRPANRPPEVTVSFPEPGDTLGPKSILRGKLQDPDADTLKVELWVSREGKKRRILSALYPMRSRAGQDFSIPLASIHEDGPVDLEVTVSDSPSNSAESAFTTTAAIKDLTFDSTLPTLSITQVRSEAGNGIEVSGVAEDSASYVRDVRFRINGGEWMDTLPANGLFDSKKEMFSFSLDNVSRVKEIEIRAEDGAGNVASIKKKISELLTTASHPFADR